MKRELIDIVKKYFPNREVLIEGTSRPTVVMLMIDGIEIVNYDDFNTDINLYPITDEAIINFIKKELGNYEDYS